MNDKFQYTMVQIKFEDRDKLKKLSKMMDLPMRKVLSTLFDSKLKELENEK